MHPHKGTPTHIFSLPIELHHQIVCFLDIKDVFALRRSCKNFHVLMQQRSLWTTLFFRLRATQALPCSRAEFMALSSPEAERFLLAASKVETSFLRPRTSITHISTIKSPSSAENASRSFWRVLSFISDRFILSVNSAAAIIWDMDTLTSSLEATSHPWACFTLPNFLDYVDCYPTLYLAFSSVHGDHQSAVIYSVTLPLSVERNHNHGRLQLEAEFPLQGTELLKHMDPSSGRALSFVPPASIHVLHWHNGNRRSIIPLQSNDPDQDWNGVTSMRFCGPYILCFRARSVEAYPIPTDTPPAEPLPLLRHQLGPLSFRAVSLSRVRVSGDGHVYTIFVLANDIYQGMYHYHIRVTIAPVPGMAVEILARGGIQALDPSPLVPGTEVYMSDMVREKFVSAWSVGSVGLRGVWVDRRRGSTERRVVAFTTHPSRLRPHETGISVQDGRWDRDAEDTAPAVDGKVVHVISSYDLRDDVTICAVSEWTGRIALGSRVGAISLL